MQADGFGLGSLAAMPKVAEAMRRVAVNWKRMVASVCLFALFENEFACQEADVWFLVSRISGIEPRLSKVFYHGSRYQGPGVTHLAKRRAWQ